MVLVDTSVWVAHFRQREPVLANLLHDGLVLSHPFVTGELACGNLRERSDILFSLATLPAATSASDTEVMRMIEDRRLWGRGLGWIDAHLLASTLLSHCRLFTFDKALRTAASELDLT
jgi:predicted nucleic acid-binding protein